MANLRSTLLAWRENEARKKGVELFRILPTSAIDDIVRAMPKTKDELTSIKGIKDAKFAQYGVAILAMVKGYSGEVVGRTPRLPSTKSDTAVEDTMQSIAYITDGEVLARPVVERTCYSVSSYLDIVNRELWRLRAPIKGEVTSYKFQGNAVYFSMRDNEDGAMLSVFMWTSDFQLAGIELSEGLEVVVEGRGEIYKPGGRFNFRAETIELVGEGAYKKAYEALKKKLDQEGLFSPERKKQLGVHPVRIGLVTSRSGAVIHDFLNNLGRFGYHISFVDARVEGASAVKDILSALNTLASMQIDVLVVVRGGGSLESLQAFNNAHVVRAIAEFPAVTICAIGHDKDVPLAQLVADYAPSRPTATTVLLNSSWEKSIHEIKNTELALVLHAERMFAHARKTIEGESMLLDGHLEGLFAPFRELSAQFSRLPFIIVQEIARMKESLSSIRLYHEGAYTKWLQHTRESLGYTTSVFAMNDPERQLRLGYSLIFSNGKLQRSANDIAVGERFEVRLSDGTLVAQRIEDTKHT